MEKYIKYWGFIKEEAINLCWNGWKEQERPFEALPEEPQFERWVGFCQEKKVTHDKRRGMEGWRIGRTI